MRRKTDLYWALYCLALFAIIRFIRVKFGMEIINNIKYYLMIVTFILLPLWIRIINITKRGNSSSKMIVYLEMLLFYVVFLCYRYCLIHDISKMLIYVGVGCIVFVFTSIEYILAGQLWQQTTVQKSETKSEQREIKKSSELEKVAPKNTVQSEMAVSKKVHDETEKTEQSVAKTEQVIEEKPEIKTLGIYSHEKYMDYLEKIDIIEKDLRELDYADVTEDYHVSGNYEKELFDIYIELVNGLVWSERTINALFAYIDQLDSDFQSRARDYASTVITSQMRYDSIIESLQSHEEVARSICAVVQYTISQEGVCVITDEFCMQFGYELQKWFPAEVSLVTKAIADYAVYMLGEHYYVEQNLFWQIVRK